MQNDNPNEAQSLSQAESIYQHLLKGPITALEALNLYGCLRLSARISDLKKRGKNEGFIIQSKLIKIGGKNVAQYTLKKTNND